MKGLLDLSSQTKPRFKKCMMSCTKFGIRFATKWRAFNAKVTVGEKMQ